MKKFILIFALLNAAALITAPPARAVMIQYGTTNRMIAVTNNLPATEVRPLAAYFLFQTPATGSVTISRVTQGVAVPLARHDFSSAAALTWFPPADYPIRRGEAFAISSTVARFTLQLETSADGNAVARTDAAEWYDQGSPFTAQITGGGSTQVTVTNFAQLFVTNSSSLVVSNAWQLHLTNNVAVTNSFFVTNALQIVVSNSPTFHLTNSVTLTNSLVVSNTTHIVVTNSTLVVVTNAPQIVITNIVNVSTGGNGGGGSFIPSDAPFVTTNGTQNFWDDGGSLNYGNINGVWFSYMSPSQIGLRGESANTYYMGYQDDFGTPQLIFHDPTTGTKTLAELAAPGSALPAPWTASADGAGLHIASDNPSAGALQIGSQAFGTILSSDTHSLSLWGDNNSMQIDGVNVAFTGANDNDVWTYSAMSGWHPAAASGGSGGGDNLGNGFATNNVDLQGYTLTASSDAGPYRIGQTIQILGFGGGDGNGGAINIIGGDANSSFYTPGAITIRAGSGGNTGNDGPGAVLTLAGGNGASGSGSSGSNVELAGGSGGASDGTVVLHGNNSHGNGSGGVLLDLQNSDLKVQTDGTPTIYTGATEDVHVWTNDGNGGLADMTLHFAKGIYTGHTGP